MPETLTLKWGTVKGWSDLSEKSIKLMERYFSDGVPMSAMTDHPDEARRAVLCELIEQIDGEIWNDWEGTKLSKAEAKQYVCEYGHKK